MFRQRCALSLCTINTPPLFPTCASLLVCQTNQARQDKTLPPPFTHTCAATCAIFVCRPWPISTPPWVTSTVPSRYTCTSAPACVCMYVCACACVCVCVLHVRACMHSSNKMKLQGDESGLGSILVEGSEHNPFCNRRNVIVMDN